MKTWIVTYKQNGETLNKTVKASCIIEAIAKSFVVQSSIMGCVLDVDPYKYIASDTSIYQFNNLHELGRGMEVGELIVISCGRA
jgi:hypothetical protein